MQSVTRIARDAQEAMMNFITLALVVGSLVLPAAFSNSPGRPQSAGPEDAKSLPSLRLHDLEGKSVASDVLKGNIVVLDFWATWCGPCIAEVPALNRLQEKYAARGVKVVGVTMASGDAKEVKPFVSRLKMKYTILMGDDDQAYDINLVGFPTTYLVSRDLKVVRKFIGTSPNKADQLDADIQKLLGQPNL
jgi:thiol-disulfide isomerase/thioredoxin